MNSFRGKIMKTLDGWDLGILIRVRSHGRVFERNKSYLGISFEHIRSELISEVGWLKGGDKELEERLKNLVELGYLSESLLNWLKKGKTRFWKITQEAIDRFKGLK